jgi:DNA polymerase-3 subunit gamma/tau
LPRPSREALLPALPALTQPESAQQMLPEPPPPVALAKPPPQAEDARAVPELTLGPVREALQPSLPEPPPQRIARAHGPSRPTVASNPPAAERPPAVREAPQQSLPEPPPQAAQAYARSLPTIASRPREAARRPASEPRRRYATPRIYYVEIIEETYVNGTWVRRRYYRPARPSDFFRVR